jgi:hypothetical protein
VADLAGARAVALEERTAQDQAGADAATHPDRDEVRDPVAAGVRVLGQGGGLGVVRDVDRDVIALLDDHPEREVAPVEVDRTTDRAGPAVDQSRRADPDPEERGGDALEELVEEGEHELDRLVAVMPGHGQLDRPADVAAEVDQ